ncbi:MAG: hypothetical protein JOS17DRAFT_407388 [Linnemannia elongata]|nr:MAG: hypothetical protein JOS17DRAFT_407388 [Linnemannia elongata]
MKDKRRQERGRGVDGHSPFSFLFFSFLRLSSSSLFIIHIRLFLSLLSLPVSSCPFAHPPVQFSTPLPVPIFCPFEVNCVPCACIHCFLSLRSLSIRLCCYCCCCCCCCCSYHFHLSVELGCQVRTTLTRHFAHAFVSFALLLSIPNWTDRCARVKRYDPDTHTHSLSHTHTHIT